MASHRFPSPIALLTFICFVICGCSRLGVGDQSNLPESDSIELEKLAPLGRLSTALWTQWVKVDAAVIPESSGEEDCTDSDAGGGANVCVNGGLIRKVKIPNESSCNSIQKIEDNLGVFNWSCVKASSDSGLWIYSTGFQVNKGVSDLIEDAANSVWKEIFVTVETSNKKYTTQPTRAWSDSLTLAPDSSSARASIGSYDTLYYIDADTSGYGFTLTGNNVGLILLNGAKYTYSGANSEPVIEGNSRKYFYLEGSFDGDGKASNVVSFTASTGFTAFAIINGLSVSKGTSSGLFLGGEGHNLLISNLQSLNNGADGFKWSGSGSYLDLTFVKLQNNGGSGFEINGGDKIAIANLTSDGNGGSGANLININNLVLESATLSGNSSDGLYLVQIDNAEFSKVNTTGNGQNGVNVVSNATNLNFASLTASSNTGSGLLLGGGTTTVNIDLKDIRAHENGLHGVYLNSQVKNISGLGVQANKNTEHGLYIFGAVENFVVSDLSFSENLKDGLNIGGAPTGVNLTNIESIKSGENGVTIQAGASVIVDGLKVTDASQIGLKVTDNPTVANLKNVEIQGSGSHGVEIELAAVAEINTLSISNTVGYGIYLNTGAQPEFSGVTIKNTNGDAILMENGAISKFTGIFFDYIPGYLISASNGAISEFFNLSYGANVDPLNLYNIDTNTGANVTIH